MEHACDFGHTLPPSRDELEPAASSTLCTGVNKAVFYLPQKPYNVVGDLREQLTYPEPADSLRARLSDEELRGLLALVDLEYLFDRRSDGGVNWEQSLSLGETQRLAMARLFYHQPMFAILDECTSAVSHVMERKLYDMCQERGITCITISHRPALIAYHDLKLELDGKGGYTVEDITHSGTSSRNAITPSASQVALADAAADSNGAGIVSHVLDSASDARLQFPALSSPVSEAKRRRLPRFKRFLKLLRLLVPSFSDKAAKLLYTLVRWGRGGEGGGEGKGRSSVFMDVAKGNT